MNITVILCTYNRCLTLKQTLESVAGSLVPDGVDWEVLVVDNNSTDATHQVVDDFLRRYPKRFRYLREPVQGKSYALNTGIREAFGEILAFLDDDVTVEPTWLNHLTRGFIDGAYGGVGGRTLPANSCALPAWVSLEEPYNSGGIIAALFDLGDEPCRLDRAPYGANMAFRKSVFEKYGGFRLDLGPGPGSQIRNEDVEFGRRLLAAGERLCYIPSAIVYHPILEARVRKQYLLAWWFDYGRADVREWTTGSDVLGVPRAHLRIVKAAVAELLPQIWRWLFATNALERFYFKCQVWKMTGWIVEMCRTTKNPGSIPDLTAITRDADPSRPPDRDAVRTSVECRH